MAEVEVCSVTSPRASNQWLNYVSESITVFRMLRADGGAGEERGGRGSILRLQGFPRRPLARRGRRVAGNLMLHGMDDEVCVCRRIVLDGGGWHLRPGGLIGGIWQLLVTMATAVTRRHL